MVQTSKIRDAIILAGGFNNVELFEGYKPGYKSLLSINGRPSIAYVLDALELSGCVEHVCIVGPQDPIRRSVESGNRGLAYSFVSGAEDFVGSVTSGLRQIVGEAPVLILTADIPLVTPESIRVFVDKCMEAEREYEQNLFLSFVPRSAYSDSYLEFTKNFNEFADGPVCHGNLMVADPRIVHNEVAMQRINALYDTRKHPILNTLSVGMRVGLSFAFGVYLTHMLSLKRMAQIASWRFKLGIVPILVDYPEITIDIDEAKDYKFVIKQLEKRETPV